MNRRTEHAAGFTLIEMLVVISVIGLVMSVAVASRPKLVTARLTSAANNLAQTLQRARLQAMLKNSETVVLIDSRSGRIEFRKASFQLPRGVTIDLTIAQAEQAGEVGGIRFYPDGQSSGGVVRLSLEGYSTNIAVDWLTGEPRIHG